MFKGFARLSLKGFGRLSRKPHTYQHRVKLVLSDGRRDTAKVTWDELDPQIYAQVGECVLTGRVMGCELPATVTIHVTDASVDGEVISNQWTGSNLPLVFASHSEPNHPASYLNDKVIARKNRQPILGLPSQSKPA